MNIFLSNKELEPFVPVRSTNGLSLFYLVRANSTTCFARKKDVPTFQKLFPFKKILPITRARLERERTNFTVFRGNTTRGMREIIAY